jgi:uncharacterized repeat protein (TIGR03803 family)
MTRLAERERKISGTRLRAIGGALALAGLLVPASVATRPGQAPQEIPTCRIPTYSVLYSFKGTPDGAAPDARMIRDAAGNLYGTTAKGGSSKRCGHGCGAVFKLAPTGKETVLYSFTGGPGDGSGPFGDLVRDATGNLYGTTSGGGSGCSPAVCGVVFKLDTTGKETVLHNFGADGAYPNGLVRDAAGNLYGTTSSYGPVGYGTVFKLDTAGNETLLYSFTGGRDGASPGGVIRDAAGNLYGITSSGGSLARCGGYGCGVVFKVDPAGKETVLHSFAGYPTDGAFPYAVLVRDAAGNLYGTTSRGGSGSCLGGNGCGVVFKLDTTGKETVLHRFTGGADGGIPYVGLVRDTAGNLYGTTYSGGSDDCGTDGCGVVFKLDSTGKETVLHRFHFGSSGLAGPPALIRDSAGNLYGTTATSDEGGSGCEPYGCGVVFRLAP